MSRPAMLLRGIKNCVMEASGKLKLQAERGTEEGKREPVEASFELNSHNIYGQGIPGAPKVRVIVIAWGPEAYEKDAEEFDAFCRARERGE